MGFPLRVALALGLIYSAALAAWWVATPSRGRRIHIVVKIIAFCISISVSVFAAMVIPLDAPIIRAGIAILGVITGSRIASYWFEGKEASAREYFRFISIAMLHPYLVFARGRPCAKPRVGREIARLILCALIIPPALFVAQVLILVTIAQDVWTLNHLIVLAAFVIIMGCVGQCLLAIWRLQGLPIAHPVNDSILASRTPADFWRRWSWPPHVSLHRYIYRPLGGRRRHVFATLAVFLTSGVAHDILFFVAMGRLTGHQTLFFVLNGFGVLASPALERVAAFGLAGRVLMRTLTILFLVACSPLFFVSVHYVFPIYVKQIWLMW